MASNERQRGRSQTTIYVRADARSHPLGRVRSSALIRRCPCGRGRASTRSHRRRPTSAPTCGRGQAFVQIQAQAHPRLYNPRPWNHYLLFLFCFLVGDLGFAYATFIPTCKREGVASNLRGIPLHFCIAKIQGLYYS